jgi:tetratricopeptide (TPR) repeat protein
MNGKVKFLQEILDLIVDNQTNVEQIYEFFQKNIAQVEESLPLMTSKLISEISEEQGLEKRELIARKLLAIGNLVQQYPQENRDINLKIALSCYKVSSIIFTRDEYPILWAALQNSLGNAYWEKNEGDQQENIEQAIGAYQSSLAVYTHDEFPEEWAMVQFFLGHAYRRRMAGKHKENVEQAIDAYNASMKVYTYEQFPMKWACIQNVLGNTYRERTAGKRKENIKQAMHAHRAALSVYDSQKFPDQCKSQWKEIHHDISLMKDEWKIFDRRHYLSISALLFASIFFGTIYYLTGVNRSYNQADDFIYQQPNITPNNFPVSDEWKALEDELERLSKLKIEIPIEDACKDSGKVLTDSGENLCDGMNIKRNHSQ